jgi:23S rRNA (adenine1618-N6)-methyltransferase
LFKFGRFITFFNVHPRNRHTGRYDFDDLIKTSPELSSFVAKNRYGDTSVDFANPEAVKALNRALLKSFYEISAWDIPQGYLCPPIPGRSDYLHFMADLLGNTLKAAVPRGESIYALDVGVGASCIYPLIGNREYGWNFVGSDTDPVALESAKKIVGANEGLKKFIELRLQKSPSDIFRGVVQKDEFFDITLCNPPFHASLAEAQAGSRRKWENLGREDTTRLNFGGKNSELWCPGGELAFIRQMIQESAEIRHQCLWFSTLVSKQDNLPYFYTTLNNSGAADYRTLDMAQGQKKSRILAWTFANNEDQNEWRAQRSGT